VVFEVRAKKYLGQHFLNNLEIARQIAQTIPCEQETNVVEVGAGTGVLTQFLLQNEAIRLKAVEIDKESVAYLHNHFPTLEVIEGDFLRLDLPALFDQKPFCVIGNYPYNISSQIFFKILEHKDLIPICSGMIQKEVAERLASRPGKKSYGILSVLLQAWYDIEYLFTVDAQLFNPPPKVQSAVIRMTRNKRRRLECDEN
jgi:16S rRNA (adenine1518-N6/adenine1519-N6)-dimethyltransferase